MSTATWGNDANKLVRRGIRHDFVEALLQDIKEAKKLWGNAEVISFAIKRTKIQEEVEETIKFLTAIDEWEHKVLDYFLAIKRCISRVRQNYDERRRETAGELEKIVIKMKRLKAEAPSMIPLKPGEDATDRAPKSSTFEVGESSSNSNSNEVKETNAPIYNARPGEVVPYSPHRIKIFGIEELAKFYSQNDRAPPWFGFYRSNVLYSQYCYCMYSLAVFPENTELKKRQLIHWWVGIGRIDDEERFIMMTEIAEAIFNSLITEGTLDATRIRKHNKQIDSCTINPEKHKNLVSHYMANIFELVDREGTWHFYEQTRRMKAMLNLNQKHLNSKYISKILDILLQKRKFPEIYVAQFGRWNYSDTENSTPTYIEADGTQFLEKMGENVRYLSLNGISRIEELPESVGYLRYLMILDLRDCHDLQRLPQKPEANQWFPMLRYLDITGCYLLDHMPKWISDLHNLQVLKGAVFDGFITDQCRLRDLSKLTKLAKLGIKIIHYEVFESQDVKALENLDNLLVLTIVWSKQEAEQMEKQGKENSHECLNILNSTSEDQTAGVKENKIIENNKQSTEKVSYNRWIFKGKKKVGENKGCQKILTISLPKNLEKLDLRCYPSKEAPELSNATELKNLKRLYIRGGMLATFKGCYFNVQILRLRFLRDLYLEPDKFCDMFPQLNLMEKEECPLLKNLRFPWEGGLFL